MNESISRFIRLQSKSIEIPQHHCAEGLSNTVERDMHVAVTNRPFLKHSENLFS